MYYDIYDDIILLHDRSLTQTENKEDFFCYNSPLILKVISEGYKKIYTRTKCEGVYRNMNVRWCSPYKTDFSSPYYLCRENNKLFFGHIGTVFYNPRYSGEHANITKYLCTYLDLNSKVLESDCTAIREKSNLKTKIHDLGIVGSGISPYTIYLSETQRFNITEYECNPEAYRFGLINKKLNGAPDVQSHQKYYENQSHEIIISIIPAQNPDFHKNYNFKKDLLFYHTLEDITAFKTIQDISRSYNSRLVNYQIVRPYSKGINTYRIHLTKTQVQF